MKVLVADDDPVTVAYLVAGLRKKGFTVDTASDTLQVVMKAVRTVPDAIVLDINMPQETGLQAAARLRDLLPDARLLLLSMHDQAEYVREGMRIGTHGYILKDSAGEDLREAIRVVSGGGTFFSPSIVARLDDPFPDESRGSAASLIELLTPRERDVLARVAQGHTNKAIAAQLGIGRRTVEAHRESLMRKLDIHSVAGLTRLALEAGLEIAN